MGDGRLYLGHGVAAPVGRYGKTTFLVVSAGAVVNAMVDCSACDQRVAVPCAQVRISTVHRTFGFDCPECGAEIIRRAKPGVHELLISRGCPTPIDEAEVAAYSAMLADLQ